MISNTEIDIIVKLVIAAVLGGLIGLERERDKRPAGLRTNTLICIGAAVFGIIGTLSSASDPSAQSRIWQNIITGVGFLGAGAVIKEEHSVHGLTTAASIWAVAAIGLAVAGGFYFLALSAEVIVLLALLALHRIEHHSDTTPPEQTPSR
jgi:putative Mg2+ transporter-C (MgtC) family protein